MSTNIDDARAIYGPIAGSAQRAAVDELFNPNRRIDYEELAFGGEGKPDMVAKPGQVFLDLPGTHHTATNKSSAPARVSYAVLLPKGATLTTVDAAPSPAQAEAPAQQPAAPPAEFVGMPSTGEGEVSALFAIALAIGTVLTFVGIAFVVRFDVTARRD